MSAWVFSFLPIQFIMRSYLFEPCCMALCHCASFLCGVLVAVLFAFGFCFLCSFCFACLVGFFAHLHSDSLLDCVLVLRQHYFCGPSLNDGLITMPELMEHVACQESVWIDLAKAKRRLVGQKDLYGSINSACATFLHDLVWQLEFSDNNVFFVHSSGFAAEWWNNI